MWASFGGLSIVPWILFAQMSWDMNAVPVITASTCGTNRSSPQNQ